MAKFKASARVIDMLGRQQIAGIPTAINELFKNAHDAYADHVEIDYFRTDGLFVIRDDGMGMTLEEFESRWLTLATDSKITSKQNPLPPFDPTKELRPLLGEKGIGRLSLAVIGSQILVMTRAKRDNKLCDTVCAYIHWGVFELPGINLDDIEIPIRVFKDGNLPSDTDIESMIDDFKNQLNEVSKSFELDRIKEILVEVEGFKINPLEINNFLENNDYLSLKDDGIGTHFYIMPATELLAEDIDMGTADKASPLEKALLGFTNTMTPDHEKPLIKASFRDYKTDNVYDDLIEDDNFFTPYEFENSDHTLQGSFDDYGQFIGEISIYGEPHKDYIIPWKGSRGKKTKCGAFSVNIAVVQGNLRQSTIPFEDHAKLKTKMNRQGGLYVYKNGIRMLPYGDTDFDWLDIEFNRTKSAYYYYFSYRRMFGVLEIDNQKNKELVEKSGREGFRENTAYRQFKSILKNFFIHLAADFFRETGSHKETFYSTRDELEKQDKIRKNREKNVRTKKIKFKNELVIFFDKYDKADYEKEGSLLIKELQIDISSIKSIEDKKDASKQLLFIEKKAIRQLNNLMESYKLVKPRIGLSKTLVKDWVDYQNAFLEIEKKVFDPIKEMIESEISYNAEKAKLELSKQIRIENALKELEYEAKRKTNAEGKETKRKLTDVSTEAKKAISDSIANMSDTISRVFSEFNHMNIKSIDEDDIVRKRLKLEEEIVNTKDSEVSFLKNLREQLENITLTDGISSIDQIEALEQRVIYLEDQADTDLQLTQLGMAIEVINHEFTSSIKSVRNNLREFKAWADFNEKLEPLYNSIHSSFEHLDNYLTLFTPLHRRIYKEEIEITGATIDKYLHDLFQARLERHEIKLNASDKFLKYTIWGYPSSFYPVFVNIIDNAIFWLKGRTETKNVNLDILNDAFIISNNGPAILDRDRKAIFELGFTKKPGGRGMGLHISKEVLKKINYDLILLENYDNSNVAFALKPLPDNSDTEESDE